MKKQLLPILLLLVFFKLHAQNPIGMTPRTNHNNQAIIMSNNDVYNTGSNAVFYDDGAELGNVGSQPIVSTFIGTGQAMELFFTEFKLPAGAILNIYKGNSVNDELLASFEGGQNQKPWNFKARSFTIEYIPAPNGATAPGWRGEIHELTAQYLWEKALLPESDCINAIPICSNSTINTSANQYEDTGSINDDTGGCYSGTGNGGSVWYQFTPQANGPLDFAINPSGSTDYDFVLWDITAGCASRTEMSCNFAAPSGPTGLSSTGDPTNSQDASGGRFNQRLNVDVTRRYAICINYYSGTNAGFNLTFQNNAGSVAITDNTPPTMSNVTANNCASASSLNIFFSEYIDCATLQSSDFTIPGRTVTITANNCTGNPSKTRQITVSVSPALTNPGTYTLTGNSCNDLCGNPLNGTFNVVLGPVPTANAGPDRTSCRSPGFFGIGFTYTQVTLTAAAPGTNYFWSDGQTGASINVNPTSLATLTYTVSVQNGSACVATDQAQIFVENTPRPNLGATQTVCSGFPVTLFSTVAPAGVIYQWQSTTTTFFGSPTSFVNIAGQNGPNLTITPAAASTWYRVIVTSTNGCQGTSTVRINQGAGVFAITPSTPFACAGSAVTLTLPSNMTTYTWSTGTNANQALTVVPVTTTTYSVTSTTAGCSGSASVTIPVRPVTAATAAAAPAMVCPGDPVSLTGSPAGNSNTITENFEGTTNIFTLVNGSNNRWFQGTAAFAAGTKGLYIGTAVGNNNYAIGSFFSPISATNFAFRDIPVTSFCNANFAFKWRCNGQSGQAELRLWLVPTTFTPVAGTAITASASNILLGGPYFGQAAAFQNVSIDLTPYAGQTRRLVFEWKNTGAALVLGPVVANPAAAIDDISFTESTSFSYNWSASTGGFSSSAQNVSAFPSANTTYTLQATRCDGCVSSATTNVSICILLELELSKFKANCEGTKAKVEWAIENEAGIDSYILQYSSDAINFENVAQLNAGFGNYESLVNLFNNADNHYFRLKQINTDGTHSYSSIIQAACQGFEIGQIDIFPNPTSDNLNVRFGADISGNYNVSVIDVLGRTISKQSYQLSSDNYEIQINTVQLIPAVYFVKISDKNNLISPKILKFVKE